VQYGLFRLLRINVFGDAERFPFEFMLFPTGGVQRLGNCDASSFAPTLPAFIPFDKVSSFRKGFPVVCGPSSSGAH